MSSADEAGPSRRSGRRTPRIRYDVSAFDGIEGMDDDGPPRRPPSTDDSNASDDYGETEGKGKGRASQQERVESPHSDSEYDEDEIDAEVEADEADIRMNNMDVDSSMDEDEDEDEYEGSVAEHKPKRRPPRRGKSLEAFRLQEITPRDEHDVPDDKAVVDFNTICDPGYNYGHKYVIRRDQPRRPNAIRFTQTPVRPLGLSRLKEKPHLGRLSEVEYTDESDCGTTEKYNSLLEILHAVPSEIPWDLWKGEGWWSDCWTYDAEGKANWTSRSVVDIGLHEVGRLKKEDMRYLNADQAKPYLAERNRQNLTLLLGLDNEAAEMKEEKIETKMFDSRKLGGSSQRQANLFDAGGYVSGLEWCPMSETESSRRNFELYLAVTTLDPATQPNRTGGLAPDLKGTLQIWTISPGSGINETGLREEFFDAANDADMKCSLVLCFEGGPIIDFKWMPVGCCDEVGSDTIPKIGIISAVMTDGTIRFFSVPDPRQAGSDPVFVHVEALLILGAEDGAAMSLDWGSSSMLAVGLSNGSVCIWDNVVDLLTGDETILLPTNRIPIHTSAVQTVRWARMPAADASNRTRLDLPPPYLLSASWDGTLHLVDMRDSTFMCDIEGQPRFHGALEWSGFMESILWVDSEYYGLLVKMRRYTQFGTYRTQSHDGPLTCFGASDYHGMLVSGGADGVVGWTNSVQNALRYKKTEMITGELYQLDVNRNTGEYRMLGRMLPETSALMRKLVVSKGKGDRLKKASPSWPPEISITSLAWNNGNGIGRAGMIASASASGLCRIDYMQGYKEEGKLAQFRARIGKEGKAPAGERDSDEDDEDDE